MKLDLHIPGDMPVRCSQGMMIVIFLLIFVFKALPQDMVKFSSFGFHNGFSTEDFRIEKCKTYYDSVSHVLFNPCYDFHNRGIYSSYHARQVFLGNCMACDSILIVLPRRSPDIGWEDVRQHQQEAWDYYLKLWKKQDKLEKYYIDLEGTIRNFKPLAF